MLTRLGDVDPVEIAHALDALDRHLAENGIGWPQLAHRVLTPGAPDHWDIKAGIADGSFNIEDLYKPR